MAKALSDSWRLVHGQEHWKGMLEPLDEELCKELIRYGHLVQTVYDSFNSNAFSKQRGLSRYGKSEIFSKLHVQTGYEIKKYIYCSTQLESLLGKIVEGVYPFAGGKTSWFGYIAVSDEQETKRLGRRDIVVVFRGTLEDIEWASNLLNSFKGDISVDSILKASEALTSLPPLGADTPMEVAPAPPSGLLGFPSGILSNGVTSIKTVLTSWQKILIGNRWLVPYTGTNIDEDKIGFGKRSAREQIMDTLTALIDFYKNEELSITVTGHSLGAALATVCAYDIANEKKNVAADGKVIPVAAFPFASPRVGNQEFKQAAEGLQGLRILRIANEPWDIVTKVPPFLWGYEHVGKELTLNTLSSQYLRPILGPGDHHNLQVYLHLIATKKGSVEHHQLELVNKGADCLKSSSVPGNWWSVENNYMVADAQGRWALMEYNVSIDDEEFN